MHCERTFASGCAVTVPTRGQVRGVYVHPAFRWRFVSDARRSGRGGRARPSVAVTPFGARSAPRELALAQALCECAGVASREGVEVAGESLLEALVEA